MYFKDLLNHYPIFSLVSKIRLIVAVLGAILGLWLFMAFPCWAEELSPSILLNSQELEQFLDGFFAEQMKQQHVPGAALVLVKDGEILLSKGYGYADVEKQTSVSPSQTLWRVGSVSKLLTATAVMQLVEQGKINLNEDINRYLKDFPIPNTYSQPIKTANLLTHTDGFDFGWGIGVMTRSPAELKSLDKFLRSNQRPRLLPPGEIYFYGDVGLSLAGNIVERISGLSFSQYVDKNILQSLKMRQSTFEQPLPPLLAKDLAVGYKYENGKFKPRPFAYYQSPPTGAFTASATDMAHFMVAHLQNGRYKNQQILQEATVQEHHRQQFTHHPLMPGSTYGFYEHFVNGQRALEHSGRMNGYNSLLMLVPQQNLGIFLAYNNNGGRLIREFTEAFFNRYYPKTDKREVAFPQSSVNASSKLRQLAGIYRLNRYSHTTIDKLGVILGEAPEVKVVADRDGTLRLSSKPEVKWVEVEPLLFQDRGTGTYLSFRENDRQQISYMFLGSSVLFAFEKLAWYEAVRFQAAVIAICLITFLLALGRWIGQVIRDKVGKSEKNQGKTTIVRRVAVSLSALNLIFLGGTVWATRRLDFWEILVGLPPIVRGLLFFPPISVVLAAGLVVLVMLMWIRVKSSLGERLYYSGVALAGSVFAFYLSYWNLLGYGH